MPRLPVVIANAIRQKRQVHNKCFLIVEGHDDRKFFRHFTDRDGCQITVANGKQNVIEVIEILESDNVPGTVGVMDADLDHIEGKSPSTDNLIVLETADLEALLICCSALDRVLVERGSEQKMAAFGKNVQAVLVAAAVWIGCLRLYSHREELNLKLQGLRHEKFLDKESLAIDPDDLVREAKNRSQRHDLVRPQVVKELGSIRASLSDPRHICFGKDMVKVLAFGLTRVWGSNNAKEVRPERLASDLRLAFHWGHMNRTKLSRNLREWEAQNPRFRALRPRQPDGRAGQPRRVADGWRFDAPGRP